MALKNDKSLGQHWLKDRQVLDEIADLAVGAGPDATYRPSTSSPDDAAGPRVAPPAVPTVCLEIGPGLGT